MTGEGIEYAACVTLWRAKIAQMLSDATADYIHGVGTGSFPIVRAGAQAWFSRPAPEFEGACLSADLCPRHAPEAVRELRQRLRQMPKAT